MRPIDAHSHEWLARVNKDLSSTSTRTTAFTEKRSVQRMVYSSRDTGLSSLKSIVKELFIPSMKVTLVLRRCNWGPESVFWPKITADTLQAAQSCKVHQTFPGSQWKEILMPHKVQQWPLEKIGADFFHLESTNYLLITDYSSQCPIIRRMRSTTTNATIDVMKQVFSEYVYQRQWWKRTTILIKGVQSIWKPILLWPHHIKPKVPTEQWHDRGNSRGNEAVTEEIHGSRTWSLPSYAHLQGNTIL